MKPETFLTDIIDPSCKHLADIGGPPPSQNARRLMLAIAMQECGQQLNARYQNSPSTSPGPARGWWQFEQGGGVKGVLTHKASATLAKNSCDSLAIQAADAAVWRSLEGNDRLAGIFSRLLLWTDPAALPSTQQAGWDYYQRNWRPGKPHPETWPENWRVASAAVDQVPLP